MTSRFHITLAYALSELPAHICPHITRSCLFTATSVPSAEESNMVAILETEAYVSKQNMQSQGKRACSHLLEALTVTEVQLWEVSIRLKPGASRHQMFVHASPSLARPAAGLQLANNIHAEVRYCTTRHQTTALYLQYVINLHCSRVNHRKHSFILSLTAIFLEFHSLEQQTPFKSMVL